MMAFIIYPLGDSAVTIELGSFISEALNQKVIAMQKWLKQHPLPGLKDVRIAFTSLTLYYDLPTIKEQAGRSCSAVEYISNHLERAYNNSEVIEDEDRIIKIPVCYHPDLGLDLTEICNAKSLTREALIDLHTATIYRIYMIGFLPGFPYMGEVNEKIAIERKPSPRQLVPKGSVGIAGRQTGIYPMDTPGGWQIIGRTPFKIFDPHDQEVIFLHPGEKVQFSEISLEEFHHLNN
jgi:inhibitor of KinA